MKELNHTSLRHLSSIFKKENVVVWLCGNDYRHTRWGAGNNIVAWGEKEVIPIKEAGWKNADWTFFLLSYDLKNAFEKLSSDNYDGIGFPETVVFKPENVQIFDVVEFDETKDLTETVEIPVFKSRFSKKEYLQTVETIRQHIIEGDLYEMNLCQEFYCENVDIQPFELFLKLNEISPTPFAALVKYYDKWLICASPERFVCKNGNILTAQPIKGTSRRSEDPEIDLKLKQDLTESEKNRAENVMIVDLMRNDFSKICTVGSVTVPELFGAYSFKQVHHLISTIQGELKPDVDFYHFLKATFPMGSMTGAPKVMSMELIERYECSKRGLFSGSVGYITPEGDMDCNVVIRSLFYNQSTRYLSYQTGGAIVYDSVPDEEYNETILKAEGIRKAFSSIQN